MQTQPLWNKEDFPLLRATSDNHYNKQKQHTEMSQSFEMFAVVLVVSLKLSLGNGDIVEYCSKLFNPEHHVRQALPFLAMPYVSQLPVPSQVV